MSQSTLFHYIALDSPVHSIDPRFKFAGLLLVSAGVTLATKWWQFAMVATLTLVAFLLSRLPVKTLIRQAMPFLVFISAVFVADLFLVPGQPIFDFLPFATQEGLQTATLFAIRILIVLALCILVMGTTTIHAFKQVVEWITSPLPFLNGARIATTLGLTFTMLPVLFDSYYEITDAQKARCVELRKNPIARIVPTIREFLLTTMRRADEITYAMEARCYSDHRTRASFSSKWSDWLVLMLILFVFVLCLL